MFLMLLLTSCGFNAASNGMSRNSSMMLNEVNLRLPMGEDPVNGYALELFIENGGNMELLKLFINRGGSTRKFNSYILSKGSATRFNNFVASGYDVRSFDLLLDTSNHFEQVGLDIGMRALDGVERAGGIIADNIADGIVQKSEKWAKDFRGK